MPAKFPEESMIPPADFAAYEPTLGYNPRTNYQHGGNTTSTSAQQQQHGVYQTFRTEELVISGISARLPEAENMEEFGTNLFNGVDMITDDGRRWTPGLFGLPTRCGKIKELDKFDATFFNVHAKQSHLMDPQLRMLLELTYEAIIDAGVNPTTVRGSRTGKSAHTYWKLE
jgi:hypothetical protein